MKLWSCSLAIPWAFYKWSNPPEHFVLWCWRKVLSLLSPIGGPTKRPPNDSIETSMQSRNAFLGPALLAFHGILSLGYCFLLSMIWFHVFASRACRQWCAKSFFWDLQMILHCPWYRAGFWILYKMVCVRFHNNMSLWFWNLTTQSSVFIAHVPNCLFCIWKKAFGCAGCRHVTNCKYAYSCFKTHTLSWLVN